MTKVTSNESVLRYLATMVNGLSAIEITPMTATLKFLSRITDELFESQMQRAARKICERQYYFGRAA